MVERQTRPPDAAGRLKRALGLALTLCLTGTFDRVRAEGPPEELPAIHIAAPPAPPPATAPPPAPGLPPPTELPNGVVSPSQVMPPPTPVGPPVTGGIVVDGQPLAPGAFERMIQGELEADGFRAGCAACGQGRCYPGRPRCEEFPKTGPFMNFLGGIYECICCPDPCYEPRWTGLANNAFFTEGARPVSQTRVRYDSARDIFWPDRGEYFWARADGRGRGPRPVGRFRAERKVSYDELNLYTEAARGAFSVSVLTPYRHTEPETTAPHSGFGDIIIGTKSLLVDCELFLLAMQFNTYIPSGNAGKGLGTGHVSLEPGLLGGLRVSADTYLQFALQEWIPLGGDPSYQGSALKYSASYNCILWRPVKDVQLISSLEYNGLAFQDGQFTDKYRGSYQPAAGNPDSYLGAGIRLIFCDKVDLGFGTSFAISERHLWREFYRTEFRVRY